MEIRTIPMGITERIDDFKDKTPDFDPRSGDHLWVMVASWKCDPEKLKEELALLDHENLLSVGGPGCYFCEEEYTPRLAKRRCRGHG